MNVEKGLEDNIYDEKKRILKYKKFYMREK